MTTLPTTKHALVIQGTEQEKQQACIKIRDWAVKNGIPIYIEFKNNPRIGDFAIPVWDYDGEEWMILRVMYTTSLEEYGYTIHHTVESFKAVFESEEPVPTPFGEAIILLRDLADLQNGAPLERYRKEWEETIEKVYAFLNKWEDPIELTNPKN